MMKRLLLSSALIAFFAACAHEEYTQPSPIEMKPRTTKPDLFDQETPDKFGDEGMEPIDMEEKNDSFDPKTETQKEMQDDIATLERRKRAKKLTSTEVKNITIKRKTADAAVQAKGATPKPNVTAEIKAPQPKKPVIDLKLEDDDFDVED